MLTGGHWPGARRDVPDRRGFCSWEILLAWLIKIRPSQRSEGDTRPAGWPLLSLWAWSRVWCVAFLSGSACWFSWFFPGLGVPILAGLVPSPIHAIFHGRLGAVYLSFFPFLFPSEVFF